MFIPKHFEIQDKEEIFAFIKANAFGQLISSHAGKLLSTHLPFLVSHDRSKLIAHLARQNPQWQSLEGQEVLITLEGPHDYISPSWYSSPSVPTWNYQAVHIYGICTVFNDTARLKKAVDDLSHKYESSFEKPWQPVYREAMLNAIVGVEIEISDIQCQYKLSQNRSAEDRQEVIKQLKIRGASKLAAAMEKI